MSTNFYLQRESRDNGPLYEGEHIGKRSVGWTFSFCGMNHQTLDAWEKRLAALGKKESIVDEYGRTYTAPQFWAEVARTFVWNGEPARQTHKRTKEESDRICAAHRGWNENGFSFSDYEFC
jgi:DNA mismatch repair ATPase MutS